MICGVDSQGPSGTTPGDVLLSLIHIAKPRSSFTLCWWESVVTPKINSRVSSAEQLEAPLHILRYRMLGWYWVALRASSKFHLILDGNFHLQVESSPVASYDSEIIQAGWL